MKKQGNSLKSNVVRTGWRWLAGSFAYVLAQTVVAQTVVAQTTLPTDTTLSGLVRQRCGTVEYEQALQQRNPRRLQRINNLNRLIEEAERNGTMARVAADTTVYRIPVVVHVVHDNASLFVGGANNPNISDEQIQSQIPVLNEDYRRKPGTNGYNTSPIGADARIEFYLATTDPNGNPTNGITRHYYAKQSSFDIPGGDDVVLSQIAYWPSDRYLNIWVTKIDSYLGYTNLPEAADTLSGLDKQTNEFTDGSFIDYRYFGKRTGLATTELYADGRTTTHEIGHWLGLIHTWGDGDGCNNDYVADTPPTKTSNNTRFCNPLYSMCDGKTRTRDLIENYMEYSPDLCMNMFTQGQVARMRTVLTLSPRRARLLKSLTALSDTPSLTINVYPNPAPTTPTADVQFTGFQSFTVDIVDLSGRALRTLSYTDAPSTRVTLPTSGLAAGMYIVRVRTGSQTASKRLLVR